MGVVYSFLLSDQVYMLTRPSSSCLLTPALARPAAPLSAVIPRLAVLAERYDLFFFFRDLEKARGKQSDRSSFVCRAAPSEQFRNYPWVNTTELATLYQALNMEMGECF
jgi:hypothetical protein